MMVFIRMVSTSGFIRYADVLLMLAECEAEVGTPAQAASYINEVRPGQA